MLILALETSDLAGSVALLDEDQVLQYVALDPTRRSAKWLAPAINQILENAGSTPRDLQLIAVTTGPGSFTGLRVGVTTAKTLAYAVGCPVIGINTLEAIALRAPRIDKTLWAVIDAQRQQLFAASFQSDVAGKSAIGQPTSIITGDELLATLAAGDMITGPGVAKVQDCVPPGVAVADPGIWPARAIEVGLLGFAALNAGRSDNPFSLVPQYFRPTAAEEQWARKNTPPAA